MSHAYPRTSAVRHSLLIVTLGAASLSAFAATPPATPKATAASAAPLSRNELRSCMDRQVTLDKRRAGYDKSVKEVNDQGTTVSDEGNALTAAQAKLDTKNATAVNAFTKRVAAYDKRTEAYQTQVKLVQDNGNELTTATKKYENDCAKRPFLPYDREAILTERNRAASSAGS